MNVCVISFKECWRDASGRWRTTGGFPGQMRAVRATFDAMTLLVVEGPDRAGGEVLPPDARVVPLRRPEGADTRRKLSVLRRLPEYLGTMRREVVRADVVHAPVPGDLAFLGLLTGLAMRRRVLARYCGAWVSPPGEATMMNRVTRQVMRLAAGPRHVMLATGMGHRPPAPGMHWLFASALTGHEVGEFCPDLDRVPGRPFQLAWAGRLAPEKGVADLCRALASLREHLPPEARPVLHVAGDGPERGALASVADAFPGEVHLYGNLDRRDLLKLLASVDALVLPSHTEAFAKARLDAFLAGAAVITTDVGHARALLGPDGERGWVVPPHDPEALAAAILSAMAPGHPWPALRRRCRETAEQFTLEAWQKALEQACVQAWGPTRAAGGPS